MAGVPNLWDLLPNNLKWSWCDNNRSKVPNKCNVLELPQNHPPDFDTKSLTVWITTNYGKFLKTWEYQTTWPASWEMQVKKQQLEPDVEQQTSSKSGKEYVKAPAYLTYMQSASCKMPGWMKHKLESRLLGEISITSDMQMTPPLRQKAKKNYRASWWKWKKRVKNLA